MVCAGTGLWILGGGGGASIARINFGRRVLGEDVSEGGVGGASIMRIRLGCE